MPNLGDPEHYLRYINKLKSWFRFVNTKYEK